MPTRERVISVVADRQLQQRLRAEATRQGKSVSRLVREIVEERLRPSPARGRRRAALLRLSGLADGELVETDIDRELYGP